MGKKSEVKRNYNVLSRLRHDGERYESGDQVELTDTEASGPLTFGVVKLADKDATPAPTTNAAPTTTSAMTAASTTTSATDAQPVNVEELKTKDDIVQHAKDVHGLDLDVDEKRDVLIAQVKDAQAKASETESAQ